MIKCVSKCVFLEYNTDGDRIKRPERYRKQVSY